ncbi:Rieske (2Fe-2S) protein [Halalkalibacter okhensis]|uniref:2Fe-2S ferredoxin n=1 Tax=Halalkalibacter okhensis TaxID=333138 RepID=A0A0B0IAT8_9BACI|nr:Rieske (2Fe-2S) protein [Halalkalibacter okhensis]KHF37967.1 2Fe-2S ferredoxin [Halalkalibacter okhensis]
MAQYIVANVDEIPPGERKVIDIKGRSIGVFNINGDFFAIRNNCPHQGAPLCEGGISGIITSQEPGEYNYSREGEFVRCPWHSWEFDIKTGQSYFDPRKTLVKSYKTNTESGCTVQLGETQGTENRLEKGPFVVESYPVSLEKEYVVITV